jgi:hypothetical protein
MTDTLGRRQPPRTPATRGRRFKPHAIELTEGGRLLLGVDGSIDHVDDRDSSLHRWKPDDPGWSDQAIRFGLYPQPPTVAPSGRRVEGSKPPRR